MKYKQILIIITVTKVIITQAIITAKEFTRVITPTIITARKVTKVIITEKNGRRNLKSMATRSIGTKVEDA